MGTKGPGETQIETDRRAIRTRIGNLKEAIGDQAGTGRAAEGSQAFTRVAMVGYERRQIDALPGADRRGRAGDRSSRRSATVRKVTPDRKLISNRRFRQTPPT